MDLNLLNRSSNAPTHAVQPPLNPPKSMLISLNSACAGEAQDYFFFQSMIKKPKRFTFNVGEK